MFKCLVAVRDDTGRDLEKKVRMGCSLDVLVSEGKKMLLDFCCCCFLKKSVCPWMESMPIINILMFGYHFSLKKSTEKRHQKYNWRSCFVVVTSREFPLVNSVATRIYNLRSSFGAIYTNEDLF